MPREAWTRLVPHGSSLPGCLWFSPPPRMWGPPAQLLPGCCILLPMLCSSGHAAQQDKPGTEHPQLNFFYSQFLGKNLTVHLLILGQRVMELSATWHKGHQGRFLLVVPG